MPDLEQDLRDVAAALVANPPAPPPFPDSITPEQRPFPLRAVGLAAAAAVVLAGALAMTNQRDARRVDVAAAAPGRDRAAFRCTAEVPLRVTAFGTTSGPVSTEAPGTAPAEPGQRVMHWTRADGAVELRWPAPEQVLYGDGKAADEPLLPVGEFASPSRVDFDVAPRSDISTSPDAFDPDVRVEPAPHNVAGADARCDTLVLRVILASGSWSTGLRAAPASEDLGLPYEPIDVQPVITHQRAVTAAPDTVVACEGSGMPGGPPPHRTGGPDPDIRGDEPSDVLRTYIARTPGSTRSGYVEMTTPDGNVTYAVDASGRGWTTIVSAARDATGWHLAGWKASGC